MIAETTLKVNSFDKCLQFFIFIANFYQAKKHPTRWTVMSGYKAEFDIKLLF